jgi:ATP phosphoribosyltransferase regulatory subunit HisZ
MAGSSLKSSQASKSSPEELKAERQRLHDLIQKRSKDALKAAEEMSKHPLSSEQKDKQREAMNEQFRKGEEERRKRMRTSGK